MLVLWISGILSLGPVFGGLINPQDASLFFAWAVLVWGIGSAWTIWNKDFHIPNARLLGWASILVFLSFISAYFSPIPTQSFIAWRSLFLGLWIIPMTALIPVISRARINQTIFFSAYLLCAYAILQIFIFGHFEVSSFFPNPNILASFIVLVLPLAWEEKKIFLTALLTLILLATKSVGAWMSLAIAALILERQMSKKIKMTALFVFFVCGVLIFRKPQFDFQNRWVWWQAALRVIFKRPWLGVGPGVLTYLIPTEVSPHLLRSLYAHEFYLETAAGCGINYLLIFLAGLFFFFPKSPLRRLAILASLILGFWDYSLSVPAIFFIFCYLAASEIPRTADVLSLGDLRFPLALLVLVSTFALSRPAWARWQEERLKSQGISLFNRNAPIDQVHEEFLKALSWAPDADVERLLAEIDFQQGKLLSSAKRWEKAAQENPCRPSTWKALENAYNLLGEKEKAQGIARESVNACL